MMMSIARLGENSYPIATKNNPPVSVHQAFKCLEFMILIMLM